MDNITERIGQCRAHIDAMQQDIQERVESAEKSPVLQQIATEQGYKPAEVRIGQSRLLRGHYGKVYAMQWCPQSQHFLVSASQDGNLILWNALSSNKIHAIPLRSSWVMSCTYSQTGQLVACGGLENVCYVYRLRDSHMNGTTGTNPNDPRVSPSVELSGHDGYISSCRFVSDSEIVTASGDSTCILWNVDRRQQIQQFTGHYGDVMSISTSGNHFISGSVDASVKLWDLRARGNMAVKTFRGHNADVNSVTFFPDGNAFATGSDDGTCRLFDTRAVAQVNRFAQNNSNNVGVTSVSFSGTGRLLFSGYDDNMCMIYDTLTARPVGTLPHDNRVSCLGVNPAGTALCTGSWDAFLRIWT